MARLPIVLIHGYSADSTAFVEWQRILQERGYSDDEVHVLTYQSLTNEVTIDDIAEAFDRALDEQVGLSGGEAFDAMVHSTGMLVLRAWLTGSSARRGRVRHLIALAPATFGSPLAHKGRGWLGAALKGNRNEGPDFREAGDLILDGLELASQFTWNLAHKDLLTDDPFYGDSSDTPYVFTFCGVDKYDGFASLVSEDGTDGTVRLAGCPLNTRMVSIDLTRPIEDAPVSTLADVAPWSNTEIPLVPIRGLHHSTIVTKPSSELVELVFQALSVSDPDTFAEWLRIAEAHSEAVLVAEESLGHWQQFVFRVVDHRDEPVQDYVIEFIAKDADGLWQPITGKLKTKVHPYGRDKSLRCFHVDIRDQGLSERTIGIRITAATGSTLVGYHGSARADGEWVAATPESDGLWRGTVDVTRLRDLQGKPKTRFFHPFTTTLVSVRLARVPLPMKGFNELALFEDARRRLKQLKEQQETERRLEWERGTQRLEELEDLLTKQSTENWHS